jgi:hypothetical protein
MVSYQAKVRLENGGEKSSSFLEELVKNFLFEHNFFQLKYTAIAYPKCSYFFFTSEEVFEVL